MLVCVYNYCRWIQWLCIQKTHTIYTHTHSKCISGETSQRRKNHMHYHHCPKDISSWWWNEAEHSAAWKGSARSRSFSQWKKVCWVIAYRYSYQSLKTNGCGWCSILGFLEVSADHWKEDNRWKEALQMVPEIQARQAGQPFNCCQ